MDRTFENYAYQEQAIQSSKKKKLLTLDKPIIFETQTQEKSLSQQLLFESMREAFSSS
jgi:hypothetical protein